MPRLRRTPLPVLAVALASVVGGCRPDASGSDAAHVAPEVDEILWDEWGVPHVFGTTDEAVFRGAGWATMANHGDLVLQLYGESRGRAAEYWGEGYLDQDRFLRLVGVPARGEAWLAAEADATRIRIEAFVAGMNAYAEAHPDRIDDRMAVVLPVTAADVLAHANRVLHFTFITNPFVIRQAQAAVSRRSALGPLPLGVDPAARAAEIGSNAWAIAPERTESGDAILVANPHLPWDGLFRWFEMHLVGPDSDVYGATLVGLPGVAVGFNDRLGWTHTVNTYDGADLFGVEVTGDGYRFGDEVRPFTTHTDTLRVRQDDGTLRIEALPIPSTVHGPVVARADGRAVALRVAGMERSPLQTWWDLGRARDLATFEGALSRLEIPMFNVIYADADGQILYLFNGALPRRETGDVATWAGVVDGSDPATLWTGYLGYEQLPRVANPATGWVQNANDPPWTSTVPQTLDAADFPAWLSPLGMHFRAQRSANMLRADPSISFDEVVAYKHSTVMESAVRVVDDLVAAARDTDDPAARRAADVLDAWDRTADADSRGGLLFEAWLARWLEGPENWSTPWSPEAPSDTPRGIADPDEAVRLLLSAADDVEERYGALDVAWGEIHRARRNGIDVPASGGQGSPHGIFRVVGYQELDDGTRVATGGDGYYAVMRFGPDRVEARVLLAYGNASQPGSPHDGDQLTLYGEKTMRTPWRERGDIEAHLEARETLPGSR